MGTARRNSLFGPPPDFRYIFVVLAVPRNDGTSAIEDH